MAKQKTVHAIYSDTGISAGKSYVVARTTHNTYYVVNNMSKITEYPKSHFSYKS